MKKTVLIFGLISGAVSSLMMIATVPFLDRIGHDKGGYVVGYTAIVLSFLLVLLWHPLVPRQLRPTVTSRSRKPLLSGS